MFFLACFFLSLHVKGQTDLDALRYSKASFGTTARSMAMGGAFGALGADFSVLSQNPAGIGLFRKNEFSVSPMFNYRASDAMYIETKSIDGRLNFGFGNFGVEFCRNLKNANGWKNWNFGIGYNRINSFSGRSSFEGINKQNSLLDSYIEEANGVDPTLLSDQVSFEASEAFNIYLLDSINGNQYYSAFPNAGMLQRKSTRTRGSVGEWDFSFGGNYNDKLFLGASIGINTLRYIEDSKYEEIDSQNLHDSIAGLDISSFSLNQYLNTSGTGINLKLGIIYKPADWIRIGTAFHTPAYYNLSDDYSSYLIAKFANGPTYTSQTLQGNFDYTLLTPLKAIGSLAFIINNFGLISADYEFIDYASAKLSSRDYSFSDVNGTIDAKYRPASNIRLGAEYKYDIFSFRLGGAYYGSPFQMGLNLKSEDQHQISYTGGLGIRGKNGYIDIAYALAQSTEFYRPYGLTGEAVPGVKNKLSDHRVMVTFGVRW